MTPTAFFSGSARSALPVAIVGGGVTGLAAAYHLARAGQAVRVFEASPRLGGAVQTERTEGWLIEAGPNSFQENSRAVVELIHELGLDEERVAASREARKRFIVRGGRMRPAPTSPAVLLTTSLFSAKAKLRLFQEFFQQPRQRSQDVSLADFIRDHFCQEIVDYALNPFVSGVYAGDPAKLSARHAFPRLWESETRYGSILRGQIAEIKARRAAGQPRTTLISFRSGLETLVERLALQLPAGTVERNAKIESLLPGAPWQIVWSRRGAARTEEFSHVVLAVPAASLASLKFGALADRPLAALAEIQHPPVASLFLGFRRDQVAHPLDGFGVLVPALEKRSLLGALFSSTLFPGRAPAGHVSLTVLVGGSIRPGLARGSLEEITAAVMPDLKTLLGVKGPPVFSRLHFWPRAIPQYQIGYERFLETMSQCEATYPGLTIGGQVRDGIALPSCLQSGFAMATHVLANLSNLKSET